MYNLQVSAELSLIGRFLLPVSCIDWLDLQGLGIHGIISFEGPAG